MDRPPAHIPLPFSLSQQEVWLDQRAWPASTHLNIGGAGFIEGRFDLDLFREALRKLVAENEALRLVPMTGGGQRLLVHHEPELRVVQIAGEGDPWAAMRDWWQAWMSEPYAFDGRPPWRFALLRHSDQLHGLTIQFHHLIMDGWGTSQVMQRWAAIYNALAVGTALPAKSDPGYQQFIAESNAYRDSAAYDKDAAFWQAKLPALPEPLFERHYPAELKGGLPKAHLVSLNVARREYDEIGRFAQTLGVTRFTFCIAVLAAYLARAYGRHEIVIGLPTLNRSGKRYRETLGMFVGVFPLVVPVDTGMTVAELMAVVDGELKRSVRHQRYPVSNIARNLGVMRHRRDSLFDVLFSYERQDYDLNFGEGCSSGSRQIFSGLARYPLGITLGEFQSDQDAELTLEANPQYFTQAEVGYLGKRLINLMQVMVSDAAQLIRNLPLVAAEERAALLGSATGRACGQPEKAPYFEKFRQHANAHPEAIALVWDEGQLDYAALDQWSDWWARRLQERGAGRDSIVAMALERSPEMLAVMIGISKAGAAFLPLDPDAPLPRLSSILKDSGALALLVHPEQLERFAGMPVATIAVGAEPETFSQAFQSPSVQPGDLAYVLFTSGSTGRPKGVMLEHRALSLRLDWISRTYEVRSDDRSGQCTQVTFDPSLIELFLPLINGASVAMPPRGRLSPNALGPFVIKHQVSILALVPATLRGLLDSLPDNAALRLRVACCGGEVLPAELSNRYLERTGARLFNVYGPTETSIFATAWSAQPVKEDASLPLGAAIDGSQIYVLDAGQALLPYGVPGEIHIAGQVIARGYLGLTAQSQEAFTDDPFVPGARMYRTGDRGWLADDGQLHFCGRIDRQIKLRGYRIEPGEIETALLACDGVRQAAVKALEVSEKRILHAWVGGPQTLSVGTLRQAIAQRLPDYMMPAAISLIPELPLNSTGKIAYDLLPEPIQLTESTGARPPESDLERSLLALWRAVMKKETISVSDNFFDLGGDSLAAIDILAGAETLMGRKIPFYLLPENPTVELLARVLGDSAQVALPERVLRPLSRRPAAMTLYFAASGYGDLIRLQTLADALDGVCELVMLQPPADCTVASIHELAEIYCREILAHGSTGAIAGFSVGAIVALETSRKLIEGQFAVSRLLMIDAVFPGRLLRSAFLWRSLGWLTKRLNTQELSLNGRHLGALFNDAGLITQIEALAEFRPSSYEHSVVQIQCTGLQRWRRWFFDPWSRVFGASHSVHIVPGLHGSIFEPSNVKFLAEALGKCLAGGAGR